MGSIYRRQRTPYYWACWRDAQGREHRASTRCRDRRGAQAFLRREEGKAAEGVPAERGAPLFDLIERWTRQIQPYSAPRYLDTIGMYIRAHIAPYFGDVPVTDVTAEAVAGYARHRLHEGVLPQTVNKELITIRRLLAFCEEAGAIKQVPRIRAVRVVKQSAWHMLADEEIDKFLDAVRPKLRAYFTVAAFTGMRRDELWHVRWMDVDLEKRLVHVRPHGTWAPKDKKARVVPMHDRVHEVLSSMPQGLPLTPIFGSHRHEKAMQTAAEKAGLGRFRLHDLRHSFASNLLAAGADPVAVRDILGHASLTTTNTYSHSTMARMKKAVGLLQSRRPTPSPKGKLVLLPEPATRTTG
jgi:integrase